MRRYTLPYVPREIPFVQFEVDLEVIGGECRINAARLVWIRGKRPTPAEWSAWPKVFRASLWKDFRAMIERDAYRAFRSAPKPPALSDRIAALLFGG